MQRPLLLLIILSIALSGCFTAVAPKTINITVEASKTTISPDETVVLTASVAENGKPLVVEESQIAWELSNTSTAQLSSSTGRQVTLTALTSGSVTITAVYGKHRSQALTITVTEPEPPPPDLENAIKIATQLIQSTEVGTEPGQAPQEAHDALQAAIDAAQDVLNDENATQAEVDSATQALLQAIAAFEEAIVPDEEPGQVDKTALAAAIAEAEDLLASTGVGINKGQAPVHAHHALEIAVNNAAAVEEDDDATQEDVDDAVAALQQAIVDFENEIVTDEDPLKVYTFPIDSSDSQAFSADKGQLTFNSDPKYIKTGTTSIKYTITGTPSDFRIRIDRKQGVWETDWTDYDYFAVWIYVEDVERLNKNVAFQWGYGHESGGVRITVPRSAFVNGWNELRFNLRDDLGFTDEDLANMTTLIQLRLRNISGEDTLYIDEIRLLKLEEAEPVDKTYLEAAIQNAIELKGSILVGTEPGQAPQEAHDALQAAIDAAQDVLNDENATQAEVDSATQALLQAIAAFEAAIVPDEEPEEPEEPEPLFSENFDAYAEGDAPEVTGYTYSGDVTIVAAGEKGRTLKLAKTSGNAVFTISLGDEVNLQNHSVSFMINKPKNCGSFNFNLATKSMAQPGFQITNGNGVRYRNENGGVSGDTQVGTIVYDWVNLEIKIADGKYSIWADGEQLGDEIEFSATVNHIRFEHAGYDDTEILIDDIIVKELSADN